MGCRRPGPDSLVRGRPTLLLGSKDGEPTGHRPCLRRLVAAVARRHRSHGGQHARRRDPRLRPFAMAGQHAHRNRRHPLHHGDGRPRHQPNRSLRQWHAVGQRSGNPGRTAVFLCQSIRPENRQPHPLGRPWWRNHFRHRYRRAGGGWLACVDLRAGRRHFRGGHQGRDRQRPSVSQYPHRQLSRRRNLRYLPPTNRLAALHPARRTTGLDR